MSDATETNAAAWTTARRFAETPCGRIAYVERGSADRVALFLHGFPLNGFQWRGQLDRLSDACRRGVPDLMGLGYSQVTATQRLKLAAQAAMPPALLERPR